MSFAALQHAALRTTAPLPALVAMRLAFFWPAQGGVVCVGALQRAALRHSIPASVGNNATNLAARQRLVLSSRFGQGLNMLELNS